MISQAERQRLCFVVYSIRISKWSSGANRPILNASSFTASLSSPLLTAMISNQGRRLLLMNQYELTDTLPSLNLSSPSSSPPSLHICECYLTRLICQPQPFSFRLLAPATWSLPPVFPPVPTELKNCCVSVCVCVFEWVGASDETETKLSRAELHTGAALLGARGVAVKVFSF